MTESSNLKTLLFPIMFLVPLLIIGNLSYLVTDNYIVNINKPQQELSEDITIMIHDLEISQGDLANIDDLITELINSIDTETSITIIDIDDQQNNWQIDLSDIEFEYNVSATVESINNLDWLYRKQIPLIVNFNSVLLKEHIILIASQFDTPAVNAYVETDSSGNQYIVNEEYGKSLDIDKMYELITDMLKNNLQITSLYIVYNEIIPDVTASDLTIHPINNSDTIGKDNGKDNNDTIIQISK